MSHKHTGQGEGVVIMYRPHEPGIYTMTVKFGPDHVLGALKSFKFNKNFSFCRVFKKIFLF